MYLQQLVAFAVFLLKGCNGLLWSTAAKDHARLELCSGEALKLNWPFDLSPGERVEDMEWRHVSEKGKERVVATHHMKSFTPMAEFSGRVSHNKGAALELSCATILESGNYTVVVSTLDVANTKSQFNRAATVVINDTPKTLSGELEVQQKRKAVRDVSTNLPHVQLTCGQFTDRGHPVFEVIWKDPNGEQHKSDKFDDGYFHLTLPNPPTGGNYSCSLPSYSPAARCLTNNSELRKEVTIDVDEVAARFTILEAQQAAWQGQLDQETEELRNKTGVLEQRLDVVTQRVSFHANLGGSTIILSGGQLVQPFGQVSHNEGLAFDNSTGIFTAPVSGTYFFVASTGPQTAATSGNLALIKEGSPALSSTYIQQYGTYEVMGSCHATVHLSKGNRVWLECELKSNFWAGTSFTGFLLYADN